MQLVIAEKPSVGRDLARVLGVRGTGRSFLEGPRHVITWCIGHLVELEEPASYDARWKAWRFDTLPMVPDAFKLRPVPGTRDQLGAVRSLLRDRRFTEVVNGCDAGREGELIFRYVYELAQSRLPVRRLWISSMTDEAIRQGFAALRPGRDYDGLADAARCRSEADWLVGMNATRAVTLRSRTLEGSARPAPKPAARTGRGDMPAVYSIGRVQTPTLAILVRRELAIRAFQPKDYWEVRGTFTPAGPDPEAFAAAWTLRRDGETTGITRFSARTVADEVVARTNDHRAASDPQGPVVERLVQKRTREPPPLLFDLTSLQRTANRRFGFSATRTLETAQALYERHKLLTYPRTDSRHLPPDQVGELPRLFAGLAKIPAYAPFAEPLLAGPQPPAAARSKRIFDASKVQDHHAIIPTGKAPGASTLTTDEQRIFDLVARRFLAAFHPDAEFALTEAVLRVGSAPTKPGAVAPSAATRAPSPPRAPAGTGADAVAETMLAAAPPPPDRFIARGRVRLVAGWQTVAGLDERKPDARPSDGDRKDGDKGEGDATLPSLAEGQRLDGRFETLTRQTRPPARHTEATLLGAMESAGREIDDEALRAAMKDTGLGTPATRAATIETLVKRAFIAREGKQVVPTATGIALIEGLPVPTLASPELTGTWEARLARIARGQDTRAAFMKDIVRYVHDVTDAVRTGAPGGMAAAAGPTERRATVPQAPAAVSPARGPTKAALTPSKKKRALTPPSAPTPVVPAPSAVAPLPCPACHVGALMAGKRGWGCSRWREGCAFVVWFMVNGRRLTDGQLRDLVAKGKTRRGTWTVAGQPPTEGRLILDLTAQRDQGAARFQPG